MYETLGLFIEKKKEKGKGKVVLNCGFAPSPEHLKPASFQSRCAIRRRYIVSESTVGEYVSGGLIRFCRRINKYDFP